MWNSWAFDIQHLTLNIPRHPKDPGQLNQGHPRASLNAEGASGDPGRTRADGPKECCSRSIPADSVAENRSREHVPGEVNSDGKPKPYVSFVCKREEYAGEHEIGDCQRGHAAISNVQHRKNERCDHNRCSPVPMPHFLEQISAESN